MSDVSAEKPPAPETTLDASSPGAAAATPTEATATAGAKPALAGPAEGEFLDVWSWTAPKYRQRAITSLLINVVLFCGLCVFTNWLHVGQPFQFGLESYLEPLRFWGPQKQVLYNFVLQPISVDQTPVYGIVIGLLMAAIVAVPISVSVLYRFPSAIPFCAAVFVFAHMPWMALTLLGSCILASVRPFRMSFRFGSALVGMLPVLVYLFMATRGSTDELSASISPERKLLLTGPWLLAILAACMMLAVMIFIARAVNYRPGTVAPIMAVMFATPAILFHSYVGLDQLTYRVLEGEYGPRSKRFEPVQKATERIVEFVRQRTERGVGAAAQDSVLLALWSNSREEQTAFKHRISNRLLLELLADREAAYEACKEFIADHPDSRFVPNVLYIQARALDTRLDELQFTGAKAQRELYTDFPHTQSEPVWTNLLTQFPDSPLAVAARLRVAQLRLRRGDAAGALVVLKPVPAQGGGGERAATQPAARSLLRALPPESSLEFDPEPYLFEAERLRELITANCDDPKYGVAPLQALAALDPHRAGYEIQLARLAQTYADARLYDNIVVRWADAHADRDERAAKLRACVERFGEGDALAEAMFELADLEVQAFGTGDESRRNTGIARLREVTTRFPNTCWARLAAGRLRMVEPGPGAATQRTVSP